MQKLTTTEFTTTQTKESVKQKLSSFYRLENIKEFKIADEIHFQFEFKNIKDFILFFSEKNNSVSMPIFDRNSQIVDKDDDYSKFIIESMASSLNGKFFENSFKVEEFIEFKKGVNDNNKRRFNHIS